MANDWQYKDSEMDAWSNYLADPKKYPAMIVKCSYGHSLETPIELTQQEIDDRCIKCSEGA